ncbi:HERV-H LTR-associating protein 3, partial [Sapajus apella]|uniref:HERV-H LTR-associating protein 3 n=1 Tax=Sapajus apella TaxID=9515 RepID=A0A6J3JDJ6_SAPAP
SGSEPPAEECRMTPRHAGCDASEMHRILIQSAFSKHLLRATHLVRKYVKAPVLIPHCKKHCRRGITAKYLKAEAGRCLAQKKKKKGGANFSVRLSGKSWKTMGCSTNGKRRGHLNIY